MAQMYHIASIGCMSRITLATASGPPPSAPEDLWTGAVFM